MMKSMHPIRTLHQKGNNTLTEHCTREYLWWEVSDGEGEPTRHFQYPEALAAFYALP